MPFGIPKSENERRETHKIIYGNTKIPKKRSGLGMSEAIRKAYTNAGQTPPDGKGIHTMRAHKCVISYLKKGLSKDEAWKRCMGSLGRNLAVKAGHRT